MNQSQTNLEKIVDACLRRSGVGHVLLGISGGADSTALLLALRSIGVEVEAVHCNFHLRGEESERDMHFVEKLCAVAKVSLDIVDFNVEKYIIEHGVSIEMACRDLRYNYFRSRLNLNGIQRIAVAHNSDDNIETMLLNLFRGTGLKGLRGMLEDTGEVIRPLLKVSRKEIEKYLKDKNVSFVNDSTNSESEYKRNFIRNEILPKLESRWPGLRHTLTQTMENVRMEEIALDSMEKATLGDTTHFLPWNKIEGSPGADWVLRRFCSRHCVSRPVTLEIITSYKKAGRGCRGKQWVLSDGKMAFGANGLYFWKECISEDEANLNSLFEIERYEVNADLRDRIRSSSNSELWVADSPANIIFRKVRPCDRIYPMGMKGSKLVSDVIKEFGISPEMKSHVVVAEDTGSGEILWIEGMKRSRKWLIDNNTSIACRFFRKYFAD